MKKVTPNGAVIKLIREELEKGSTQKELAHEAGISVRLLRQIENENATIAVATAVRLARALGVHRERIVFALDVPKLVPTATTEPPAIPADWDKDRLIPRHDYDIAQATMDEGRLFKHARNSTDIACHIETPLNEETGGYAQELFDLLTDLTWTKRSILDDVPAAEEISIRRRIRQLLVLLKGNDVWVYETHFFRRLPERYDLPPPDEPSTSAARLSVALGPPGEYGETSIRIPIDHGQPFILPSWKSLREQMGENS